MVQSIDSTRSTEVPKILMQKRRETNAKVALVALTVLLIVGAIVGYFLGLNSVGVGLLAGFGGLFLISFALNAVKWHKDQKKNDEDLKNSVNNYLTFLAEPSSRSGTTLEAQRDKVQKALDSGADPRILYKKDGPLNQSTEELMKNAGDEALWKLLAQYDPKQK